MAGAGQTSDPRAAVCVEVGVGAHVDHATLAWVYDERWWGLVGQGSDEASALADLDRASASFDRFLHRHGQRCPNLPALEVVERIHGDERAFDRDHSPATDAELARTQSVLRWARHELLELVEACTDEVLDWDDPERSLPEWASWRTLRQMAFHVADTESRFYLAALGIQPPSRADDLRMELRRSHRHVMTTLPQLERALAVDRGDERWTTRKVLRRLAWHERGELEVMHRLRERAVASLGDG